MASDSQNCPLPAAVADSLRPALGNILSGLEGLERLQGLQSPESIEALETRGAEGSIDSALARFTAMIRSGAESLREAFDRLELSEKLPERTESCADFCEEALPGLGDLPVLNPEQIDALREEELLDSLKGLFREMAGGVIDAMAAAVHAGNAREFSSKAHLLKGSAVNFGADRLVAVCQEIEQSAPAMEPARWQKLLDAVRAEYQLVSEALNAT